MTAPAATESEDIAVQLTVPEMDIELPELPAMKPTGQIAENTIIGDTELQLAERSKQLAEQIAKTQIANTQSSIQDTLPDGPDAPLQELGKAASEKANELAGKVVDLKADEALQIPSDEKLDEELNAALVSMKSETTLVTPEPPAPVNADHSIDMKNVVSQPATAAQNLGAVESSSLANLSSPMDLARQDVMHRTPQDAMHRTTSTPEEANTAIAAILEPGSSAMNDFTVQLPIKTAADLADTSAIPALKRSVHHNRHSPKTSTRAHHMRVANWLQYLPTSVKR